MKSSKKTLEEKNRWVVSTDKDFKEARNKGLHRAMISLAAKKEFKLCPTHISALVWMTGDALEKAVFEWYEAGGEETYPKDQYFMGLEDRLYILEDLLPYHFFGEDNSFRNGDSALFRQLNLVRKTIAFPPLVEKYYSSYLEKEDKYYQKSWICDLCGTRGANCIMGGDQKFRVHGDCPAKFGFYKCEWCGWMYPGNKKEKCLRKARCQNKKLVKCAASDNLSF